MYYSSIGVFALLILIINNYFILTKSHNKDSIQSDKAYKRFLISVAAYYIADIFWAPLYYYTKTITITFAETCIYFAVMALSVLLWTKYVILYLNKKNMFGIILEYTGWFFLCVQIIVLIINIFIPIAFWYEEDGSYHTSIARTLNLVFQIIMFLCVDVYMLITIKKTEGKIRRRHHAIGTFCLTMMVFVFLQALYPEMPFYAMGYMLGTCLLHTFVIEDEMETHHEEMLSIMQVEELQEKELGQTRQMAYSDPLTGIKNKMAYIEDTDCVDQRIQDGNLNNFGVIVFDLNDLKKVNDTQGHDAGDQYIKDASSLICNHFKHSPVYRIGGDEFVAFLSGNDFLNRDSILLDFNNTVENNLSNGCVVIAFGFAAFSPDLDNNFLHLFERADKQMYQRKKELKAKKLQLSQ